MKKNPSWNSNPVDTASGMITILTAVLVPRRQRLGKRLLNTIYLFLSSST
jgi:hypothetical protein